MELTREQELVRDTRDNNILVSAAAGSGKTKVLVDRILEEITDTSKSVDVDRILVVTFTNAAAAEMRERIRKRIDKELIDNPENKDLRRQATLIHNAQIRTIDSFCSWLVKNYFYEIDQDPAFRIGSKGELSMLMDQVLDDLIAKRFESKDKDFIALADAYVSGRKTSTLKDMVLFLHGKAMSSDWPFEWYEKSLAMYCCDSISDFENGDMITTIVNRAKDKFAILAKNTELALGFYDDSITTKDRDILAYEHSMYLAASKAKSFNEIYEIAAGMVFDRFTASKKLNENLEEVKKLRGDAKDSFIILRDSYFTSTIEEIFDDVVFVGGQARTLIGLAKEFSRDLFEIKKKKNIYDFNDIEHMALEILRDKDSKNHEPRAVAKELSKYFAEIMVDEYQDSNRLQEAILTAICNGKNYFTVGDVKQSIYAFRQADPAIFMDKFDRYPLDSTVDSVRIDLDRNFRSRAEVLKFCNDVFAPLMQKDMGNVAYDENAALKVGATNYIGDTINYQPEVLIPSLSKEERTLLSIKSDDELEARVVAKRIKELIDSGFEVCEDDSANEGKKFLRPLALNDIVILMRATNGHADIYLKVLKEAGIPAYVEEETGFFERDEVQTVLSMLEVIDNPNNDIPLAAVLHSPMYGLSTEELAKIRTIEKEGSFYQCVFEYAKKNDNNEKLNSFVNMLADFREKALDTPIHEMISLILSKTGYGLYVSALSMGSAYMANLNKLIDEAIKFEAGGSLSLSRFVDYINNLKTYKEELGLAKTVNEKDVAVRIMTIHKSKGLEFPVVFLCRASSSFMNDSGNVYFHPDYGIALGYKNPVSRVVKDSILVNVVKERLRADGLGEEQRILYVALTRAKEKMIVVGTISPKKEMTVEQIIDSYSATIGLPLSYEDKFGSSSYLEWMIKALRSSQATYQRKIITAGDIIVDEAKTLTKNSLLRQNIETIIKSSDKSLGESVASNFHFEYKSSYDSKYKAKYSVSEIKHKAMEEAFEEKSESAPLFIFEEEEAYVPSFMLGENESVADTVPIGALYGTAMHRFLECFDFSEDNLLESFDSQLEFMKSTKSLGLENEKRINIKKLKHFMNDETALRMQKASKAGLLYKEQPFVLGASPEYLFGDSEESSGLTLVQGIIDVFFEEDGELVLLDYKTDRVDEAEELVLRYEKQLRLYQRALESALEIKVKDVLIYSFNLEKTISLGV